MVTNPDSTFHVTRLRPIAQLALPIVGGMASQNVLNLVDTAMVGTLGDAALAAVGAGGFVNFASVAMLMGLSSGVQAMVARRQGAGETKDMAVILNGAICVAILFAIPWSAILIHFMPDIFALLNPDAAVVSEGSAYLQLRLIGVTAVGINFSFRGYWNGINRSAIYMRTLIIMHASNILFNWLLIFGKFGFPEMGTAGAGLASAISTYIGVANYLYLGRRHASEYGFLKRLPRLATIKTLLRLSLPFGTQQSLFAAGHTLLFWILGQVGTRETAAAAVLIPIMLIAILPGLALGMSAATLVGQALGRKDPQDANRWAWDVVKISLIALGILGLPMLLVPNFFLSFFLHNPETMAIARVPLMAFACWILFDAIGLVLMHAHLGAGDAKTSMKVTIGCQWIFFLPLAYLIGPVLGFGILGIWIIQGVYRGVQTLLFVWLWRKGDWQTIKV